MKGTLLLRRSELSSLLSLKEYIIGIENAFKMHGEGSTFGTDMIHGDTPGDVEFHIKVGGLKLGDNLYFGLKINGSSFKNMEKYGLPNIMGAIILFDASKALPIAIIDAGDPTVKRTGAATAVAAKYLAKKNSKIVTICGAGTQGKIQLKLLKEVLPSIDRANIYDLSKDKALNYAEDMKKELGIDIIVVSDLKESVNESDIVVTCTPSKQKYLLKEFVKKGTFIAAVGADSPDKQEIDENLFKDNKIIVDIYEQCAVAGELHHALNSGIITKERVHGELGQVIAGKVAGRVSDDEIIIYDATGTALQDTAAAAICYEKAIKNGIGRYFNFFE
ncbi:MAG: ornithine cyclodeaminase family protein [Promethearchaeota archaeon]